MTWNTILHYATFNQIADQCCLITGVYPTTIGELKKAMLGYDISLLINNM